MDTPRVSAKFWIVGLIVVFAIVAVVCRFAPHPSFEELRDKVNQLLQWAGTQPFWLFIILVGVLPLLGIPASGLYVLAGAVYAPRLGVLPTTLGILLGLSLNMTVSYFFAHVCRDRVRRLIARAKIPFPTLKDKSAWKLVLFIRITPGAPLMIQNLFLSLAHAPFFTYLFVSLIAEFFITLGYITLGHSFTQGHTVQLFGAIGIIIATILAISLLRERLNKKKA